MFSDYEDPLSSRGKPPKKPARKPVGQKRKFASKLVPRHSSRWVIVDITRGRLMSLKHNVQVLSLVTQQRNLLLDLFLAVNERNSTVQ